MTTAQKAVEWAIAIAKDPTHGYDQQNRYGPDYDCSSLIISAYKQAGVPLTCTYTGNMLADFHNNGFKCVSYVPAQLQPGDVLLNVANHTAMYIGNGEIVQASGNEKGGVTGGQTGDQTGREINISNLYWPSYGWDYVLRYQGEESMGDETIVKADYNDSWWSLADRYLGDGTRYQELKEYNGATSDLLYLGQEIRIPKTEEKEEPTENNIAKAISLLEEALAIIKKEM